MKLDFIDNIGPDAWDEAIKPFGSRHLFHQSCWLKFLEETQNGQIVRFRILDGGKESGYFVGLIVRKGPFRILGSPLKGWMTDYMGPIVDQGFDTERFLDALDDLCRKWKVHHVELCNPCLDPDAMLKKGFATSEGITYIIPLSPNEEEMWERLDRTSCRQPIKKAKREGLMVEEVNETSLSSFIEEFYGELQEVFAKQGLVPTFNIERVRSLFRHLRKDQILTFQVKHGEQTIATGIFPHDDRCVYGFGAASWKRFQNLRPNELLFWAVMTHSAKMGIKQLDLTGKGSFKPKFGGQQVPVYKYHKSYSVLARLGRETYKLFFFGKQKIKGKCLKTIQR